MNRVQTVTHKHHRVENQVEKPSRVHEHLAGTPRRAHGLVRAVVSWPGPGRIMAEALAVSWPAWPYRRPPLGRVAAPRSQCPLRRVLAPQRLCRSAQEAVSQALPRAAGRVMGSQWPYRGLAARPCCDTA